ncbi:hypothetical protein BOX15_Mlig010583g1, partial [Macrostomum lignano]
RMSQSRSRSLSRSPRSPRLLERQELQRRGSFSRSRSRSPLGAGAAVLSAPTRSRRLQSKKVAMLNLPYSIEVLRLKSIVRERLGFTGYLTLLEEQGRFSGIGYMDFRTYEGAEEAIQRLNGMDIDGRRIKVREEVPSDRGRLERMERESAAGIGRGGGGGGGGRGRDGGSGYNRRSPERADRGSGGGSGGSAQALLNQLGIRGPISNSVFVSNLDSSVNWQKLKDVFRLAGRVVKADIIGDPRSSSGKVAGLVQFETPLEAAQAISMLNNQMLYNRPMRVRMDLPEGERPDGKHRGGSSGLPEGLGGVGAALDQATARELQGMLGGDGRHRRGGGGGVGGGGGGGGGSTDTVFVSNLPYSYDWSSLKKAFRGVGGVRFADVDIGPDKRSLGTGHVQFSSSSDARRAVSMMDGVKIEGRSIRVALR